METRKSVDVKGHVGRQEILFSSCNKKKKKSKWDRTVIKYKATANKILTDVSISSKKILYLLTPMCDL